ncbi:hypothetical protein ON010_g17336 [Phytophthora cinnamomi]|nr:hypothetical protein ON010_g17336 [Phytophthora cinnamomi]
MNRTGSPQPHRDELSKILEMPVPVGRVVDREVGHDGDHALVHFAGDRGGHYSGGLHGKRSLSERKRLKDEGCSARREFRSEDGPNRWREASSARHHENDPPMIASKRWCHHGGRKVRCIATQAAPLKCKPTASATCSDLLDSFMQ